MTYPNMVYYMPLIHERGCFITVNKSIINQLAHLYVLIFNQEPYNEMFTFAAAEHIFVNAAEKDTVIIALKRDKVIGFLIAGHKVFDPDITSQLHDNGVTESAIYIAELAVAEEFRHQGIGTTLVETFLKSNHRVVYLRTGLTNNDKVINWYKNKFGFYQLPITMDVNTMKNSGKYETDTRTFLCNLKYKKHVHEHKHSDIQHIHDHQHIDNTESHDHEHNNTHMHNHNHEHNHGSETHIHDHEHNHTHVDGIHPHSDDYLQAESHDHEHTKFDSHTHDSHGSDAHTHGSDAHTHNHSSHSHNHDHSHNHGSEIHTHDHCHTHDHSDGMHPHSDDHFNTESHDHDH